MVAAIVALCERRAAEFTAPNHKRRVEQAPLPEVTNECRNRLIDRSGIVLVALLEVAVLVPAVATDLGAGQLDEPHAPLDHPSGQQTLGAENLRWLVVAFQAVGPLGTCRLASKIEQIRHLGLHPIGQLLVGDGTFQGIGGRAAGGESAGKSLVEPPGQIELGKLVRLGLFPRLDVGEADCVRLDHRALERCRQKAVGEVVEATRGNQPAVEDHVAGQFVVLTAEAIGCPGTHARSALQTAAGVQEIVCIGVLRKLTGHRANDCQLIDHAANVWKQLTDWNATFTVVLEFPWAW